MPSIVMRPINIKLLAAGSVITFGDAISISPTMYSKVCLGSGSANSGNKIKVVNYESYTITTDNDNNDTNSSDNRSK